MMGRIPGKILDAFGVGNRAATSQRRTTPPIAAPCSYPDTNGPPEPRPRWPLTEELATYETMKAKLLARHEGQHALIKGAELIGVYATGDEAEGAAIDMFGD